ncbi:MAG: hypothetical protein QW727_00510 [Candidatus Pacearchaeota archaeon]
MKKSKYLFIEALIILIVMLPISSAIFVGEAESLPTFVAFTMTQSEPGEIVNPDIKPNRHSQIKEVLEKDEEYENELLEVKYGEWNCVNNRLMRTKTSLNNIKYEYAGICGFKISSEAEGLKNTETLFMLVNIFLIIFITLTIISIIILLFRR